MAISSLNLVRLLHDGTRHELTTFQFNVCKHSCSNRTIYQYALNSNISVTLYYKHFLSKNKTKAKLRDIEAAYFVRTESIHPISDTTKVGASYRLRSDGNNNFDISKLYM